MGGGVKCISRPKIRTILGLKNKIRTIRTFWPPCTYTMFKTRLYLIKNEIKTFNYLIYYSFSKLYKPLLAGTGLYHSKIKNN